MQTKKSIVSIFSFFSVILFLSSCSIHLNDKKERKLSDKEIILNQCRSGNFSACAVIEEEQQRELEKDRKVIRNLTAPGTKGHR